MKRKDVVIGKTYTHQLDGRLWRVKVTAVEYDKDQQRHLWTGIYEDHERPAHGSHGCWGWVSELCEDSAVSTTSEKLRLPIEDDTCCAGKDFHSSDCPKVR